jgi:hypothetical protein
MPIKGDGSERSLASNTTFVWNPWQHNDRMSCGLRRRPKGADWRGFDADESCTKPMLELIDMRVSAALDQNP